MPFFVAVLEVPALPICVLLARFGSGREVRIAETVREAFAGRSVVLLLGGLAIGGVLGAEGIDPVRPLFGTIGAGCGWLMGLSHGGIALMATLAASASYIAAPAAMRMAVPEANPALSIAIVLGVTLPFNLIVGIPLYERLASRIAEAA